MKSKTKNKKLITLIVTSSISLFLIIFFVFSFFIRRNLYTLTIQKERLYTYLGEEKFEFNGKIILDKDKNYTTINYKNKEINFFSEPLYYKNKKKVLFPNNMNIVFPKSQFRQYRLNYYTILEKQNDIYNLSNNNLNYNITDAFLYDGNDLYFFITDGKVEFMDQSISISPMSYISYTYGNGELYIYNYDEDKIYYFPQMVNGDVIFKSDDYVLDVSSDSIKNGKHNKLLRKNISDLDMLK